MNCQDTPHSNAVKLYLNWYLAPARLCRAGAFSQRTDVPPPQGLKPLFDYNVENNHCAFVPKEKRLQELRKRYEGYTGPITNQGGVR